MIFCALADEENMSPYGAEWLVREHAELFEGVRHAIGEFGGFTMHVGGKRFYPIQVAEKQVCTVRMTFSGAPGHGSMPVRGAAMAKLGAGRCSRLDRRRLPVHVTPVARQMVEGMAAGLGGAQGALLRLLLQPRADEPCARPHGRPRARARPDPPQHRQPDRCCARSDKFNVIPGRGGGGAGRPAAAGLRAAATCSASCARCSARTCEMEVVKHDPGPPEADSALFRTLGSILEEADPGSTAIPLLMPGVSDARFFARLGIQTYGFTPMRLPADFNFWSGVHGADERIPADAVEFGTQRDRTRRCGASEHPRERCPARDPLGADRSLHVGPAARAPRAGRGRGGRRLRRPVERRDDAGPTASRRSRWRRPGPSTCASAPAS